MAADPRTWKPPEPLEEQFSAFESDYGVNNSEAHRIIVRRGLAAFGYSNGESEHSTVLAFWLHILAVASAVMAISFLLYALINGVQWTIYSAAFALLGWSFQYVERREPALTLWFAKKYREQEQLGRQTR